MARYLFNGFAKDTHGHVINDATCSVYLAGGTTSASVYTASSGGSAVNSVTSDTDGAYYFYVDDTVYYQSQQFKIIISAPHYKQQTYDYVTVFPMFPITQVSTKPADSAGDNGDILIYEE